MRLSPKIAPCLWFDSQAEEAAAYYASVFPESRILKTTRYTEAGREVHGREPGSVMTVLFELAGVPFTAINGGPQFKFSEAISFQVECQTQEEIDFYWARLCEGGAQGPCGWLKDRFGLSWQVTPASLDRLFSDGDAQRSSRVMTAMLGMKKLDLAALQAAAAEPSTP